MTRSQMDPCVLGIQIAPASAWNSAHLHEQSRCIRGPNARPLCPGPYTKIEEKICGNPKCFSTVLVPQTQLWLEVRDTQPSSGIRSWCPRARLVPSLGSVPRP